MTTAVRHMASCEKPREKFLAAGPQGVTDQDLLAILLRTGTKGESVLDVARHILQTLPEENVYYLGETDVHALCGLRGIGTDKAVTVCAAVELGRRSGLKRMLPISAAPKRLPLM